MKCQDKTDDLPEILGKKNECRPPPEVSRQVLFGVGNGQRETEGVDLNQCVQVIRLVVPQLQFGAAEAFLFEMRISPRPDGPTAILRAGISEGISQWAVIARPVVFVLPLLQNGRVCLAADEIPVASPRSQSRR